MAGHRIGTRQEWLAAREKLLEREKEHTRLGDDIAQQRRELPWVPVEKEYRFDTDEGEKSLEELFDGRSQLLVYHFMFGPTYEAGCPVNSSIADAVDCLLPHLRARDATFLLVSQAPLEKLQAYKRRMGWSLPWVSSSPSDFNFDLGFSQTEDQSREGVEQMVASAGGRRAGDALPPIVEQNARATGSDIAGGGGRGRARRAHRERLVPAQSPACPSAAAGRPGACGRGRSEGVGAGAERRTGVHRQTRSIRTQTDEGRRE